MSRLLNTVSLRSKILAGFALVLGCTLALGGFALNRFEAVHEAGADIRDNWLPSTHALGQLAASSERLRATYSAIALAPNEERRTYYIKASRNALSSAEKALRDYEPLIDAGEETRLAAIGKSAWAVVGQKDREFMALLETRDANALTDLLNGAISRSAVAMRAAVTELADFNLRGGQQASDRSAQLDAGARRWIGAALGATTVMCLLVSVAIVRGVSKPLAAMTDAMRRLAGHDMTVAIPGMGRGDEIGAMASAVAVFRDNMAAADRLTAEGEHAAAEREGRVARVADLVRGFEARVGEMTAVLAAASTELEATASAMSDTAGQTNAQAGEVTAAAAAASVGAQTVAAAAEELSASIHEISRQVAQASSVANKAVERTRDTDATVRQLTDGAERIGHVVSLIADIAGRTNLLALNATIEAARAGDAGKGFAVVASEVKSLANQTAKATDEIGTQIKQVQTATREAVGALRTIAGTIEEMSTITVAIAASVEEQSAATSEIARTVQQTAHATDTVTGSIAAVSRGASNAGVTAAQVLGAASALSRQSSTLNEEVDAFIREVQAA